MDNILSISVWKNFLAKFICLNKNIAMNIQTEVKIFLERKGWTQRRLAKEIGVFDGNLSKFLSKQQHTSIFGRLLPVLYGHCSYEADKNSVESSLCPKK
jgi:hypothetical protein